MIFGVAVVGGSRREPSSSHHYHPHHLLPSLTRRASCHSLRRISHSCPALPSTMQIAWYCRSGRSFSACTYRSHLRGDRVSCAADTILHVRSRGIFLRQSDGFFLPTSFDSGGGSWQLSRSVWHDVPLLACGVPRLCFLVWQRPSLLLWRRRRPSW